MCCKKFTIFVAVLNGETKDNYMSIGFTKDEAIQNCLNIFFNEENHTEQELQKYGVWLDITKFDQNHRAEVY